LADYFSIHKHILMNNLTNNIIEKCKRHLSVSSIFKSKSTQMHSLPGGHLREVFAQGGESLLSHGMPQVRRVSHEAG
jgi:hypothetical protein